MAVIYIRQMVLGGVLSITGTVVMCWVLPRLASESRLSSFLHPKGVLDQILGETKVGEVTYINAYLKLEYVKLE